LAGERGFKSFFLSVFPEIRKLSVSFTITDFSCALKFNAQKTNAMKNIFFIEVNF